MTEQIACTLCDAGGHSAPGIINGHQLRNALRLLAPDGTAEQLDSELVIELQEKDDDFPEAGLYAYHSECPEEGAILLDYAAPQPEQAMCETMQRPKSEYGCPDCGSSLIDVLAEQAEGAQGERELFVEWLVKSFPHAYSASLANHKWKHRHVSTLAWQARAALAQPSPKPEQCLVECDACPTSGGYVETCVKAEAYPQEWHEAT